MASGAADTASTGAASAGPVSTGPAEGADRAAHQCGPVAASRANAMAVLNDLCRREELPFC